MNLNIEFLAFGAGRSAQPGERVVVHYTGWLTDGTQFDSSKTRNEPFAFAVGAGEVIAGWDLTLQRLRVGDHVKVTLPPQYAYGEQGIEGFIPANSPLIFEIELLEIAG